MRMFIQRSKLCWTNFHVPTRRNCTSSSVTKKNAASILKGEDRFALRAPPLIVRQPLCEMRLDVMGPALLIAPGTPEDLCVSRSYNPVKAEYDAKPNKEVE